MFGQLLVCLLALAASTEAMPASNKQATRSQVVDRMTRTRPNRRAPAGSVLPPPQTVTQTTGDQTYGLYYTGTGFTRRFTFASEYAFPQTTTFPGSTYTSQDSAIRACAEYADEYDSFEINYDNGAENWVCTAYPESDSGTGEFTVSDSAADPVYGYSVIFT